MRKTFYFFLLLFSIQLTVSHAQYAIVGPEEYGRLSYLTYDTATENKLYALTLVNHIMTSDDNGDTWEILYSSPSGRLSDLKIVNNGRSLSFTVYTGETMYNSLCMFDLEKKEISKEIIVPNYSDYAHVSSYYIHEDNNDVIIIDTNYKIGLANFGKTFYTKDGGINWDMIYHTEDNENVFINSVAIDPINPEKIYLARGNGNLEERGGVLISEDRGKTWKKELEGYTLSAMAFNPNNPEDIFIGTHIGFGRHKEALFRSLDGGNLWEEIPIEWNDFTLDNVTFITFHPTDPDYIMILEENEIVASKDNGETWETIVYTDGSSVTEYYYGVTASFNPFNPDQIIISANFYPLISSDRGKTTQVIRTPYFATDGTIDLFTSETEQHLYYGVQFGYVHENLSGGVHTPYEVMGIDMFSGNDPMSFVADKIVPKRVFTLSPSFMGASFQVSDDHGENKTQLMSAFMKRITALATDPNNTNIIWVAMTNLDITEVYIIDFNDLSNVTTETINLPAQDHILGIYINPDNSNNILMAIGGKMYSTNNKGETWELYGEGLDELEGSTDLIMDLSVNPLNNAQLFITTNKGLFTSLDKGQTWTKIYDSLIHKAVHSDKEEGVIAGATYSTLSSSYTIIYSKDNGETWESIPYDELYMISAYASAFRFEEETIEVYVPTSDLGVIKYTIDLDDGPVGKEIISLEKEDVTVFPNPIEDRINIITNKNILRVGLYDLKGKQIINSKETEIDASGIETGIYILKAVTETGEIFNKKVMKK